MRPRSRIQTTGPNNGHQLRDYSKSSNRSENRPLIFAKSQAKAQLRAEGVKNGVINSKARSVAAMKNVRIDKANNKIDNVMESGKEMASKSIGNMTNKLVKEWIEKEK